jgi:hypothetical protein
VEAFGLNVLTTRGGDWKWRRDGLMPHFRGIVLLPELAPVIEKKAENLVGE